MTKDTPAELFKNNLTTIGVWFGSAVVFLLATGALATAIAFTQIWLEHRNDSPECVAGQPTPQRGCVVTIR